MFALPGDIPLARGGQIRLAGDRCGPLHWTRHDGKLLITMPEQPAGKYAHVLTFDWNR